MPPLGMFSTEHHDHPLGATATRSPRPRIAEPQLLSLPIGTQATQGAIVSSAPDCLVCEQRVRRGARPAGAKSRDSDVTQQQREDLRVVDLARGDHDGQRAAAAVHGVMNLGRQAATRSTYGVAGRLAPGGRGFALAPASGSAGVLLRPSSVRGVLVGPVDVESTETVQSIPLIESA